MGRYRYEVYLAAHVAWAVFCIHTVWEGAEKQKGPIDIIIILLIGSRNLEPADQGSAVG